MPLKTDERTILIVEGVKQRGTKAIRTYKTYQNSPRRHKLKAGKSAARAKELPWKKREPTKSKKTSPRS